jgi:hypothetical protein
LIGFTDPTLDVFGQWFTVVNEYIVEMPRTYASKFGKKGDRDASFLVSVEALHVFCQFTLG